MCKVSIVIPYYNSEETILRALESIKKQSFTDYEVVLVNDGSTDNSEKIVNDFISKNDISIKNINQINKGPSSARNNGIKASKGEYIAFLDSDDSYEPKKLEIQVEFMEKNKDIFITSTNYFIEKEDNLALRYIEEKEYVEANFYKMLFKFFFYLSSTMIRREIFEEGIFFEEGRFYAEDHLLFLQIARKYRGARLTMPLVRIYKSEFGEGGLTKNLNNLKVNEFINFKILYKENVNHDKKISMPLLGFVYAFAYLKHLKRVWKTTILRKNKNYAGGRK